MARQSFSPRFLFPFLFLSLILSSFPAAAELPIIDAHSQVDHKVKLGKIIELMDQAGVSRTILSTRGRIKPGRLVEFARKFPNRITPSVRTKGRPYVKNRPKYYKLLKAQLGMPEFGAMAEVILWHAKKGNKAPQWVVPIKSEQVQAALSAALERKWPFIPHFEFAAAGSEKARLMASLERLLAKHPSHPFLLIHMGQLSAEEAARLIGRHPNLHFITSHSNPVSIANSNQPWVNLFQGTSIHPQWKTLLVRHPQRFVLGFDNVWVKHWGDFYLRQVSLWRKALRELPPDVAHAIAHGNAERLWSLPPAR